MEILCHTVVHRLFIFLPNSTNDPVFLNWSIGLPTIISFNIYLPLINSGPLTTCFSGLKSQQQMNGPNQNCPQITSTPFRRGNAARYFLVKYTIISWNKVQGSKNFFPRVKVYLSEGLISWNRVVTKDYYSWKLLFAALTTQLNASTQNFFFLN